MPQNRSGTRIIILRWCLMSKDIKVTYYSLNDNKHSISKILKGCVYLGKDTGGVEYYEYTPPQKTVTYLFSIIKHGGEMTLHNNSAPSISLHSHYHCFYQYGKPIIIEDLPCDDETKIMLLLKYQLINGSKYEYL